MPKYCGVTFHIPDERWFPFCEKCHYEGAHVKDKETAMRLLARHMNKRTHTTLVGKRFIA